MINVEPEVRRDKIRVLINVLHSKTGGAVTYLKNVLPLLARNKCLDIHVYAHESQRDIGLECGDTVSFFYSDHKSGFWLTLIHEQLELPRYARKIRADVTFSPANYGPIFTPAPVVMLRNAMSVGFKERRPLKIIYWILLYFFTVLSTLTARKVIAVTTYASYQVGRFFRARIECKLAIVPHGVASLFLNRSADGVWDGNIAKNEILMVSDIYVQKNLHAVVEALVRLKEEFSDIHLTIAGRRIDQGYADRIEAMIEAHGLIGNVSFVGHKTPEELVTMYRECTLFVFPSTVETFGNPLVEAMACGAAIACARSAALPEVAGDAVAYFDPVDVVDIFRVIARLLNNPSERKIISALAIEQAQKFSWEKCAARTGEVLVAAAQRP